MSSITLCVAAIQMVSINGAVDENLRRAEHWVENAFAAHAKLVLLPEFFANGYWLCEKAWETAELEGGKIEQWLVQTAMKFGIYLGGSYLQARGEDFFNIFALATPTGHIAGRVPKRNPASVEAYLFRGQESAHIIETELGRIGVGICYDNAFRFVADAMIAGDADILLMPFSAPTPQQSWYYPKSRVDAFLTSYRHGAMKSARRLGIPAILVNKTGAWESELPGFMPAQTSRYHGQSEIADSTGETVAELADEESILVGDVTMDPTRKAQQLPIDATRWGRWIEPVPWDFKLFRIVEALGRRWYTKSIARRDQALVISNKVTAPQHE